MLLKADANQIVANLNHRDNKEYHLTFIEELIKNERIQVRKIADSIGVPLYVYQMKFNDSDVDEILPLLRKE